MVRETICLYDSDLLYGRMIMQALQEETNLPGTYVYFSEWEALCAYLKSNKVTLLLLERSKEEAFYEELAEEKLSEVNILLLSEEPGPMENMLYKYLPRQEFIVQLRRWWSVWHEEDNKKPVLPSIHNARKQTITGYITFGGVGLTKYLSELQQQNIGGLVLNLELFAYTTPHDKPGKTLSDLIYLATIDRLNKVKIADYIYSVNEVDFVEPMAHYSDGYELNEEAVGRLIEYLHTLAYERIILITDCRHRGAVRLLDLCDEIEVEAADNPIERHKKSLMVKMFHLEGREGFLEKMSAGKRERVYGQ